MNWIKSFLLIICIGGTSVFAQTGEDVSDKEVKQFAESYKQIQTINQQLQQQMISVVEQGGFEVERFNEIQQAHLDTDTESDATEKELEMYNAVIVDLEKLQLMGQERMQNRIKDEGLTLDRYEEIAALLQGDPELQQRIVQELQQKQ